MNGNGELADWQRKYGELVKYVENGKGKILGRVYGVMTFVLIGSTYLSVSGTQIGLFEVVVWTGLLLVVFTILGYFYSKFGLLEAEQSALNLESPELMQINGWMRELRDSMNARLDVLESSRESGRVDCRCGECKRD